MEFSISRIVASIASSAEPPASRTAELAFTIRSISALYVCSGVELTSPPWIATDQVFAGAAATAGPGAVAAPALLRLDGPDGVGDRAAWMMRCLIDGGASGTSKTAEERRGSRATGTQLKSS